MTFNLAELYWMDFNPAELYTGWLLTQLNYLLDDF